MIIKEAHVKNFRSILDESLPCDCLTALVGRNGTGKSSFLRALEMFYDPSAKVTAEDFYAEDTSQDIEIAVTFSDLTAEEQGFFSAYIDNDTLTVVRVFSLTPGRKSGTYHGMRLQNPDFSDVRSAGGKRDITAKYNELRGTDEYSSLPTVRSAEQALEALGQWESEHPDGCSRLRDDGQFFGFTEVGQGYLGRHTRFIRVPAVRDASDDATEKRGSCVTEIMDLVVRSVLATRKDVTTFKEETQAKYKDILDPSKLTELTTLQSQLTDTLKHYAPDTSVSLRWADLADINIPMPEAEVKLLEDGYESAVQRTGHGLQRAFILTMLQHLIAAREIEKATEEGFSSEEEIAAPEDPHLPNLILAIEEPELYQHPSRQRHMASVLLQLAQGSIPGVAKKTEVIYSTHAPLFVGLDRFDQIRLLRKENAEPGKPKVTKVAKAELGAVAEEIWNACGQQGAKYTAETLRPRLQAVMTPWVNEGFFADVAVLVEGEDDRAAILGVARSMGHDFDSGGFSVVPCMGKNSLDRPLVIFRQLGIPIYVVWDSDYGEDDAKPEANRYLLRLLGQTEDDWPNAVEDRYACFKTKLESVLSEDIGQELFAQKLSQVQEQLGIPKKKDALKNPAVLQQIVERAAAEGKVSATLEGRRRENRCPETSTRRRAMIPKDCKRLAEVDFPIAEVSRHAAREKSIRHGHPSTLHLWWARRPLASSRAVLLGLLLPDPCDPLCPEVFKQKARELLPQVGGCHPGTTDEDLRKALLRFIADFANWDNAAQRTYLEVSRALVKAAHGEEPPLVVDPFAGGGSIPLEALRLGCEAFASDLNPVACLILKVMLENIPRHGPKLAEDLRRVGVEIKQQVEQELADLYPKDPDGATPIAYLWARTVRCESPNCGAEIPLARSFWLCTNANRRRALKHKVVRPKGEPPCVEFEVFVPKSGQEAAAGTMSNAKATCLACGTVLPPERVRAQVTQQHGRADVVFDATGKRVGGTRILAVVTLPNGSRERQYRLPTNRDYGAIWKAHNQMELLIRDWESKGRTGLRPLPDEPIDPLRPSANARGLSAVTRYGARVFGDLFTLRQALALTLLGKVIRKTGLPPLVLGKVIRHCNAFAFWHKGSETVAGAFGRHALPMSWDFPEFCPFSDFAGGLANALDDLLGASSHIASTAPHAGQSLLADATHHPLPSDSAAIWFTDPPYYDAIPYSDLSDFFFVWLKRIMPGDPLLQDPYNSGNPLTPKAAEVVQSQKDRDTSGQVKDRAYYENAMAEAFSEGRRVLRADGIASVVFAHKTTEGWEALLSGIVRGGWTVTGSWPIATERKARLLARDTAALATSVHLICRPRPADAAVGDWADVLRELPKRVGDWMERLQGEGVRGADLVFACIGPALEIFSRYRRVETANGREVKLPQYLEKVWEVVGRSALEQVLGTAEAKARNGAAGAVEEDARLTALFLWTLQSTNNVGQASSLSEQADDEITEEEDEEETGKMPVPQAKGFTLVFDVVRRFAQPLGINLPKWEGRIVETKKGVVRLFPIAERAKILFGQDGAQAVAERLEKAPTGDVFQGTLFPEFDAAAAPKSKGRGRGRKKVNINISDDALEADREATTLDRVHVAMLLQASGRANALRALLKTEQERGPDFLRLANALSALYPKGSEEKRLLDAMLLAVPR